MNRRSFLKNFFSGLMVLTLFTSGGFFGSMILRFLYPFGKKKDRWLYATEIERLQPGDSMNYVSPKGEKIKITRWGKTGDISDFIALSSICPHLGCQVRWEPQHNRFFCPCHNGVFNHLGKATAGPPAKEGQSLKHYPLKIKKGLLYIQA